MRLTRREALTTLGIGTFALRLGRAHPIAAADRAVEAAGSAPPDQFVSLPPLPYPAAALEPYIDAETMTLHHGQHHRAYVDKLNEALTNHPALARTPLDQILAHLQRVPESIRAAVRNNGGGHANHLQFWTVMAPQAGGPPTGAIADAITGTFGGFEKFKEQFNEAAATRFGSGWAWLSDDKGKLIVHSTANQDTPSMEGRRAIFGLDVWEHAYYLKYRNRRPEYVTAWWSLIDWSEVNRRLKG